MAIEDPARSTSAPGGEGTGAVAASCRTGGWPAGLVGAIGLILLLDGMIATNPGEIDGRSRLGACWRAAFRSAAEAESRSEVLCFGDSQIKLGLLPRVLEARLGRTAYNLAVLGGQPPSSYFLLRRVLESGHRPRALIVNFSPLLLGMDPRINMDWWVRLASARDRLELAWRAREPILAVSLLLHGAIASLSRRGEIRTDLGLASFEPGRGDACPGNDELRALVRNWRVNRGAQVAPAPFVPIQGSLPRPYDGAGWRWQPHPVHSSYVERFLALAQERGIPVYWILPPADPGWLDRNERIGTVGAYRRYVRDQVARFAGLTVLDIQGAGWGRAWFRDPIHVNRDGAIRLSVAVAEAISPTHDGAENAGRWVTLGGSGPVASRPFQALLEDLDQSRLAVNRREDGPITMEGPR